MTRKLDKKPRGQHGGARPGGGRPKNKKNRATILRETKALEVIAQTIDSGKPLAVTVLQRAMEFSEAAVHKFRPNLKVDKALGLKKNPDGNVDEFGRWFDRWMKVTTELAKYQSPQIKAMDAPTPPPPPGANRKRFTLRVFEGGRQIKGPPESDKGAA